MTRTLQARLRWFARCAYPDCPFELAGEWKDSVAAHLASHRVREHGELMIDYARALADVEDTISEAQAAERAKRLDKTPLLFNETDRGGGHAA